MSAPLTPPAAATLRWIVTEHALDRYIDRFSPAAFAEEVRDQIIALLAALSGARPLRAPVALQG